MAYNPLNGTPSVKPYAAAAAVPDTGRKYFYDEVNFKWRPFVSTAEAEGYFNTPESRFGNFSIIVNTGGTLLNGVITGGTNAEWWWKDNLTTLVEKQSGGGGSTSIEEYDI